MKLLWIICISFCIYGCSHTATFYKNDEEVGRIESGSKGVYTFKDKEIEMSADFGKPIVELGNFAPKLEN